jgi:hypothetical protein
MAQDNTDEALPLFKRSLSLKEKTFGPTHDSLVDTLYNLAQIAASTGQIKEATVLIKRTYDIAKVTRGEDHPLTQEALEKYEMMRSM